MKAAFIMSALLLVGCTTRELIYDGKTAIYTTRSFGTKQSIGELTVTSSSNSVTLRVRGYNNDQTEALGVVAEKAFEAGRKAAGP